ncbi:MAG: indolepyruvate oxidoreductase subunit beta [Chlorobi bacterium]|nr:indolepyruvate oxidoreductase subunit beta [Chlorobiota bacterium]
MNKHMHKPESNILLCGVGGQGILLASEILSDVALAAGLDVKKSEIHGMAQRGGSVVSHVRFGETVYSPTVSPADADMIISFERMETLRYLPYAKPDAVILMNDMRVNPTTMNIKRAYYPENVEDICRKYSKSFFIIPALKIARDLGNPKVVSVVMLGAASHFYDIPKEKWEDAIARRVPEKFRELNMAAFTQGREVVRQPHIHLTLESEQEGSTDQHGTTIVSFDQLLKEAMKTPETCVVIAGAHNPAALSAGLEALKLGIARPILIGRKQEILRIFETDFKNLKAEEFTIIDHSDDESVAKKAVEMIRDKEADILLKGSVNTTILMRAVLDKNKGLRTGRLLSDTFVFEYPTEKGSRLIMITDGGVTLQPTIQQKLEIIRNAVEVAHALGNTYPKVALLAASETIHPNVAATMDAAVITDMNKDGRITGCVIEGPMALDVAVSQKAAQIKGMKSEVAGQADILVTASIDTANVLAKSTTYFAGFRLAHVIVGAAAPILIPSRSDTSDAKLLSIALGNLMNTFMKTRAAEEISVS